MKKKKSSRAIIIKNNKILLFHRIKYNREYYTLIGGTIKEKETPQEALIREVKEETNLNIISFKQFTQIEDENKYAFYYIIDKYSGNLKLGGEEKNKNSKLNQYNLIWLEIDKIKNINLIPIQIKNKIIRTFT